MKVSFPTLEDLLKEARDPIRVITLMKGSNAKLDGSDVPFTAFQVVATARLADGDIGEYACQTGKNISYFQEEMKKLREKTLQMESTVKKQIESSGFQASPGRYMSDDAESILGSMPQVNQ